MLFPVALISFVALLLLRVVGMNGPPTGYVRPMWAERNAMQIHHLSVATSMPVSVSPFASVAGVMYAIVQRIFAFLSIGMDACSGRAYRARVVSEMLFQQFAEMCRRVWYGRSRG